MKYPVKKNKKDPFPSKNEKKKIEGGTKSIEVQREKYDGKPGPVQKIKIVLEQGAITEFEIFTLGTQALIFWTSGV